MAFRDELQKKIERKRQEIADIESGLALAKTYLQALEDTMKMAPREEARAEKAFALRAGSALADARDAILRAGKPLHIAELVRAIGKDDTKQNRVSLAGSLGTYAREGKVFTRPGPNVFGVLEMNQKSVQDSEGDRRLKVAS
jgi:hypothetical protein